MGFFAWLKGVFGRKDKRPFSMGLALGSGGAKGMAHLGALKAFEEAGISFDIVTGTSIGSIVGALYAKGYTSADMKGIVAGLSMREYSRNLRPYADLGFAESLLETYLEGEFSDLNKPFACWATDGDSNEGVLLNSGKIARALIASSAIPPFFRGVDLGDKKLYDGAFTNAVPADVCRNMGADFVVGIDLSAFSRTQEERGAISRLLGSALGAIMPVHYTDDCKSRGYENSDVMLKPNLREFRATDISASAMERMFELGYEEASAHMEEIKSAIAEARKKPRDRKEK